MLLLFLFTLDKIPTHHNTADSEKRLTVEVSHVALRVHPASASVTVAAAAPVGALDGEVPLAGNSVLACNNIHQRLHAGTEAMTVSQEEETGKKCGHSKMSGQFSIL